MKDLKRYVTRGICGVMIAALLVLGVSPMETKAATSTVGSLQYEGKIASKGTKTVKSGKQLGLTGKRKSLRSLKIWRTEINDASLSGSVLYRVRYKNKKWTSWKKDGEVAGTGKKEFCKIQIKINGELSKQYDIWYKVNYKGARWSSWEKNGSSLYYRGMAIEGIKIKLLKKGATNPNVVHTKLTEKQKKTQVQVDKYCEKVVKKVTNSKMSKYQKLRACYNWVVRTTSYKTIPLGTKFSSKYTFEQYYALRVFKTHRGNCYAYAASFSMLAKYLGYNAKLVRGSTGAAGGGWTPHGWVTINGRIYDPEMNDESGRNCFGTSPFRYSR